MLHLQETRLHSFHILEFTFDLELWIDKRELVTALIKKRKKETSFILESRDMQYVHWHKHTIHQPPQ